MTPTLEALGIDQLSAGERLELIELIWDSLPAALAPEDVPDWHLRELAKRRADAESQPGVGKPWRAVLDGKTSCQIE
jgi:putative addiction module component (TIGR02574 family)